MSSSYFHFTRQAAWHLKRASDDFQAFGGQYIVQPYHLINQFPESFPSQKYHFH